MASLRLGYACINTDIQENPFIKKKDRYCVNRSCIAKTFRIKGVDYAIDIAKSNLKAVIKVLEWNELYGIRLYRMSSDMFPHITNPEFIKDGDEYAYSFDNFTELFEEIGTFIKKYKHRITFHPCQYIQIGAKDFKIFEKSSRDLSAHAEILDRIGCGSESVMVVHGGGSYGDKEATIIRWIKQFKLLPKNVQNRIVIENCERQYNYMDMLKISKQINRPVVFDTHHHTCYTNIVEDLPDPSTFLPEIIKTWTKHGLIPKFHISEQAPNKRIGAHSDFVEFIPQYLLDILKKGQDLDLMIEAKAKELAVLELYCKYYEYE